MIVSTNSRPVTVFVSFVALQRVFSHFVTGLSVVAIAGLLTPTFSFGEQNGEDIAREAERRYAGWGSMTATLDMVLRNRQGEESQRSLRSRLLEVVDDGDKLMIIFDRPRDVRGTAFLTHTHRSGPDDQWLFLPALERVKRISSNNKSGPFMGSEFSYEDLASQEVDKFTYSFIRDDIFRDRATFVVERTPIDANSGYTKQLVWYDQEEYRVEKIDFFDRKDALLKSLVYSSYRQHLDRYWRPDEMLMENHQTGKSTTLLWSDYVFQADLTDRDFEQLSLRRVR